MSAAHSHSHAHGHAHGSPTTAVARALVVTASFMLVEIAGGLWANSLALVSDGVHMATDAGALVLSLFTLYLARKPARGRFTYGYQRVEILGALLNGLLIWLVAGVLVKESIERFSAPPEVKAVPVIGIAFVGLLANLLSMFFLHGDHRHNMNVRAAYLHVLTDCLGSVAALVSGVVIWKTDYRAIDPIVTILLAALMLWSSWRLVREAVHVLMEGMPVHLKLEEIESELRGLAGVSDIHDLHVWTLSSGKVALSVHLLADGDGLVGQANERLSERFDITHTTIQVERPGGADAEHCQDCSTPPESDTH